MRLADIKPTKFTIEIEAGNIKTYSPWETQEKLDKLNSESQRKALEGQTFNSTYDNIRKAFDFPTQEEVDNAVDPKPKTLSYDECMAVQVSLMEFIANLEVSKKARDLMQRFSTSTQR